MPIQNTLTLLNATVNPLTCISRRFVAISLLRYFGIISSRGRDLLQVVTSWDISRKYARSFSSYYCFFSKWDVRFHTSPDLMGMPWTVRRVNIDKYGVLFCASQDWIASSSVEQIRQLIYIKMCLQWCWHRCIKRWSSYIVTLLDLTWRAEQLFPIVFQKCEVTGWLNSTGCSWIWNHDICRLRYVNLCTVLLCEIVLWVETARAGIYQESGDIRYSVQCYYWYQRVIWMRWWISGIGLRGRSPFDSLIWYMSKM